MKAFQLVLLMGVMAASHVSWAAQDVDTQTLAPGVKVSPKDLTPAGSLPAVQRGITDKSVKRPDVSEGATSAGIKKIDPGQALGENAGNILDADRAIGMRDAKDMMDAVRNQTVEEADLGLGRGGDDGITGSDGRKIVGDGFGTSKLPGHTAKGLENASPMPEPTTPNNRSANASGEGPSGSELRPSGDLRGIMGGAASQNARQSFRTGQVGPEGPKDYDTDKNTAIRSSQRRVPGLIESQNRFIQNAETEAANDAAVNEATPVIPEEVPVPNQTQDPYGDSGGGIRLPSERPLPPGVNPRDMVVNPGPDGAMSDPKAPRLQIPEDQLVINPNPDAASGPRRTPDEGALERELEERRCKTQDCPPREPR